MIPKKYASLWKKIKGDDKKMAMENVRDASFEHDLNQYMDYYNNSIGMSRQEFFRLFVVYYRNIPVSHGDNGDRVCKRWHILNVPGMKQKECRL
jgi:hypothetical protein